MVFQVVSSTAARGLKASGKSIAARRSMGTAPKTDWTGADAVVRKYFPEDYQGESCYGARSLPKIVQFMLQFYV